MVIKRKDLDVEQVDKLGQKIEKPKQPSAVWQKVPTKPWLEQGPGGKLRTDIPDNEKAK